jgi:hypothetical protein
MSDGQIAEHCGVSHKMVANYRPTLKDSKSSVRTGRDGPVQYGRLTSNGWK